MISDGQSCVMEKEAWYTPKVASPGHTFDAPNLTEPHQPWDQPAGGGQPCLPGSLGHAQPVIPPTLLAQTFHRSQSLWPPGPSLPCPGLTPVTTETNLCKSS